MKHLFVLLVVLVFVFAKTKQEWKKRTIYQVLTDRFARDNSNDNYDCFLSQYCGGTYRGLIKKLDYITGMGFNAIWVSPIVENTPSGYHGYWMKSLWSFNPHFGSEQDFVDFVNECHKRDIWVMVDIVMNHVGPVDMDFSKITPFNSPDHYHPKCQVVDFYNQTQVELCRLANLPDLNQDNSFVSEQLMSWTKNLIEKYNIDGLRIDTVPYVAKRFWATWKSQYVGDTLSMGEVFDGRTQYVGGYANVIGSTLSYPLFFVLRDVFTKQTSMYNIRSVLGAYKQDFTDPTGLGVFIDNHDVARFLYFQKDWKLYQNALTYVAYAEGISIIYYGTEQAFAGGNDPDNREPMWSSGFNTNAYFYQFITTLLKFKNAHIDEIANSPQVERYVANNFYAFSRGKVMVLTTNAGANTDRVEYFVNNHPYSDGTVICEIFYPSDCVTVKNGGFSAVLLKGESKVFYPK